MPVKILKSDGTTAPIKKGRGRPKGSKDLVPRKPPRHNTVQALRKQINVLSKKVDDVTRENDRLARGYENNPLVLVRNPKDEKLTEEQIAEIASTPTGEIPAGSDDELLAITDRRARVGRLLLRGVPRATIAKHLNITQTTLTADVRSVREQWRRNVTQFSIEEAIGESLDFYREARDLALTEASSATNKVEHAIAAVNAALKAEDSKNAFLARLGLWDLLHDDKARAFKGEAARALEEDSNDFSKVVSFMVKAGTGHSVDGDFDDVSPLDH